MKIEIAKRLYEYRKAAGMSQEQVAERLGVSRQAVSKWECAESSPDTENLIGLALLYQITVDELLFADPECMTPGEEAARASTIAGDSQASSTGNSASDPMFSDECSPDADPAAGRECGFQEGAPADFRGVDEQGSREAYASDPAYSSHVTDGFDEVFSPYEPPVAPGEDYVDISFGNGVHVRDSKKGEEVHVGWDGIHIDSENDHVHLDFGALARMIRAFRKDQY